MKFARLIALLAQLSANPGEMRKHAPDLCRGKVGIVDLESLKFEGSSLTPAKRNELLAANDAGQLVELEVDILAYEQEVGVDNRKFLRFRDGAMVSLGRTGKGTPFLRDHEQWNSLAVAGEVLSSATEKVADGKYAIRQTVKLTAKWAVDAALRGLLKAVSIGWNPTGPIECSVHKAPVWTKPGCYCWPGDELDEVDGESGKRMVRKAGGKHRVSFIYTEAELVETSMVPIGGVRTARAEEVRASLFASLSAGNPGLGSDLDAAFQTLRGSEPEESLAMNEEELKKLRSMLGLPEDASVEVVLAAAKKLQGTQAAAVAVEAIQSADVVALNAKIAALEGDKAKRDEDTFITGALASGRIAKGDEDHWRSLFGLDAKKAVELMGKRKEQSATPVGAGMQSADDPDAELDAGEATTTAPAAQLLRIEGGDIPGGLYAVGQRSSVERKEISRELGLAVKRLETHASPQAIWWAQRLGFDGKLRASPSTRLSGSAIANNPDLDAAKIAFRAVFMQQLEMAAVSPLELLYMTVPTNTPLAKLHWMGDVPGFEEWITDRKMGGAKAYKLNLESKKWSSGLRLKNDDVKFDQLGLLPQQIGELATKGRRHRLDRMATMLNEGFAGGTGNDGLGYDGAFFFSDSHATGDNKNGTAALDATTLASGELLLESMTTYDGTDALDIHGSHLIVGPKLRVTAEKLLTQERLANGEDNYHRGKYKLIVENRLRGTYDDYWYLADLTKNIKPFIFQLVEEISTSAILGQSGNESVPSFINDELWFGAQANYNMSYFEHRLIVGALVT